MLAAPEEAVLLCISAPLLCKKVEISQPSLDCQNVANEGARRMVSQILKIMMVCSLIFGLAAQASAAPAEILVAPQMIAQNTAPAAPASGPDGEQKGKGMGGPRKQLATIIFAGLGGAILGLSTLSFYGRPQDYLSNIAIGFAVGIIVGTSYVTYKAATNPQELYGLPRSPVVPEIEQQARLAAGPRGDVSASTPFKLNFGLSF
jgi:hypothetical protein